MKTHLDPKFVAAFYSESWAVLAETESNLNALKREKNPTDDLIYAVYQGFHFFAYAGNFMEIESIARLGKGAIVFLTRLRKGEVEFEYYHICLFFLVMGLLRRLTEGLRATLPDSVIGAEVDRALNSLSIAIPARIITASKLPREMPH